MLIPNLQYCSIIFTTCEKKRIYQFHFQHDEHIFPWVNKSKTFVLHMCVVWKQILNMFSWSILLYNDYLAIQISSSCLNQVCKCRNQICIIVQLYCIFGSEMFGSSSFISTTKSNATTIQITIPETKKLYKQKWKLSNNSKS